MRDVLRVRVGHGVGDRRGVLQETLDAQAAWGEQLGQRRAVQKLHRDEVLALGFLDRVNRHDVRMLERGDRARLALEPRQAVGVVCERFGQHLQRHVTAELGVAGAIHLAHAAGADLLEDLVMAERLADHAVSIVCRNRSTSC